MLLYLAWLSDLSAKFVFAGTNSSNTTCKGNCSCHAGVHSVWVRIICPYVHQPFFFPFSFSFLRLRRRLVLSLESHFLECDFRELKSRESDFVMFGIPRKC